MAEPTPNESPGTEESRPKLVAVERESEARSGGPKATPAAGAAETGRSRRGSRWLPWLLAGLLVVALVWAGLQSRQLQETQERNLALTEQVQGLEVQLSAASLQLQTYEMKEELVRSVAADLAVQVGRLQELVDPSPPQAVQPTELP